MATPEVVFDNVRLGSHPSARDAAICIRNLSRGTTVASVSALSTVLLPKEKGVRCDTCHRRQSTTFTLRKCSRCGSYWYCSDTCQKKQWKSHHKQICKSYNHYVASQYFQMLPEHEKLDVILLTHLVAEQYSKSQSEGTSSPSSVFMSLMRRTRDGFEAPRICPLSTIAAPPGDYLNDLYSRFDNNNYVVHSHLTSYAHGIFPWASRLFNHSCSPNAVAKYIITPCQSVRMEIVSLCDIVEGEEVTIPYTDPAISFQQRQRHLELSYGFNCQCQLCHAQQNMNLTSLSTPHNPQHIPALEARIQDFVFGQTSNQAFRLPSKALYDGLPSELHSVLHDSFLTSLSETFSNASNDGPYDVALYTGKSILAVYLCIYPPFYPQTGMHTLELAKTFWNAYITVPIGSGAIDETIRRLLISAKAYLRIAYQILVTYGPEGDPGGPLDEISALESLVSDEESHPS